MERFSPSEGCDFEMEFVPVPHRDEHADTHAVVIRGANRSVLFLPDHDDWNQTLHRHGAVSIRQWLTDLEGDIALLDGSFWDASELPGRDMSEIPHPPVSETLARLGERVEGDAEVHFYPPEPQQPLAGPRATGRRAGGPRLGGSGPRATVCPLIHNQEHYERSPRGLSLIHI